MDKIGVLFVCTGNICRSPTADAVFQNIVQKRGMEGVFIVDSAGTHGYHVGEPPDDRSVAVAKGRGVDMSHLRARQVVREDFERFDYILAMDGGHYSFLNGLSGQGGRAKLLAFSANDVPDPYYGSLAGFEHVYDVVEKGCHQLMDLIVTEKGLKL